MTFDPTDEGQDPYVAPVALSGMACRLPGGVTSPSILWRQLLDGQSAISEIPADRFSIAAHVDSNVDALGKSYARWGGFITDIAGFDPSMFEISPREAQAMDPQQRLLLMVAYEAMEDAGLTRNMLSSVRTGVYVGASSSDYSTLQRYQRTYSDVYAGTGSALSIVANRISHRFNLSGPSLSIDTACSSSLVALDQAVAALTSDRIDIAIVAGVNILIDPSSFVAFSKAGMLSPTGRLSAFDRRANGYVRGEGVGAVLLMRHADAVSQGQRTRALIRATAVNQDGRTSTLTAPDPLAQRAMMQLLCKTAGIAPRTVDYVEAHGTGTEIGDPVEASAIGNVFGGPLRRTPLLLGSVKPNIGHLESAAGIAGLIKAVLCLENRVVPPSINCEEPNPAIAFEAHNMAVPQVPTELGGGSDSPLLIAVNSFGFGGTNASVLLQSAEFQSSAPAEHAVHEGGQQTRSVAVPLSAASPEALRQVAGRLHDEMVGGELSRRSITDLASSLGTMREGLSHRAAVIAATPGELTAGLFKIAEGEAQPPARGVLPAVVSGAPSPRSRLAFSFAGQGGQWWAMGRRLLLEEPAFSHAFLDFDRRFQALSGWSARSELLRDERACRLGQSRFALPAIFGLQIGLGSLWQSYGVQPDFVLGHSFGELAAAYLAGAIDLDTATRLIHARGQIRERLGVDGAMLAVGLGPEDVQAVLGPDTCVDIAAFNTAAMVTLAGPVPEMRQLSERLAEQHPSVLVRPVQSDTAWHSRQLAPLEDWFREAIGDVEWQPPRVAFVSTVTGRIESRLDADYWWRNLRQPVRYREAVLMAVDLGANAFLELSPHRVLSGLNAANAAERDATVSVASSLVRHEDDFRAVAVAAAHLHCSGLPIDWRAAGRGTARAEGLPTYPWQLSPHWRLSEEARELLHASANFAILGKRCPGPDPIWSNEITLGAFPYLRDHVVGGDVIFPVAGFLDVMLCAGREVFGEVPLEIEDFEIKAALFIGPDEHVLFSTQFDAGRHLIHVRTRTRDGAPEWILRATARLRPTDLLPDLRFPFDAEMAERSLSGEDFYALTAAAGFGYGPAFRAVAGIAVAAQTVAGEIVAPGSLSLQDSLAHPCLLDAALQLAIAGKEAGPDQTLYLPTTLRRLRFGAPLTPRFSAQARIARSDKDTIIADYSLADPSGRCLLTIEGLEVRRAGQQNAVVDVDTRKPAYYVENFIPFQPSERAKLKGNWLILTRDSGPAEDLAEALRGEGANAVVVDLPAGHPGDDDLLSRTRAAIAAGIAQADAVIFHASIRGVEEEDVVSCSEQHVLQLIAVAQSIQTLEAPRRVCEFVVITHGARSLPLDPPMPLHGLAASAVVGLVRTIASESPDLRVRQIDCPRTELADLTSILGEAGGGETELLCRDRVYYVPRLLADAQSDLPRGLVNVDLTSAADNFRLTMKSPGAASGLFLEECPRPVPSPEEVLVETAAVGLNFRDVMAVTGLLPAGAEPDPPWLNLGLEFAGNVRAFGSEVKGLAVGDRVMGMAKACLQGLIAVPARALVKVPATLSLEEAATIPSAFATAHYALARAGRLQQGEKVLIHLGTGGVGLAAIQVAKSFGAEIYATAGTEEKRAYLRRLGVAHVFDSRSHGFADDVMAETGGAGVDVILNALPSHYITKGLEVLAPFGRFLEIGKRDVYADTPLGLHGLRRNISFHVIDLAAMGTERPDLLADILAEVLGCFASGVYDPLPLTHFAIERAAEAFGLMAKAKHVGKVVIGLGTRELKARASASRQFVARHDRSYLITGGTSGFGLETARWLSRHGAGHLILASRSGELAPQHEDVAAELEASGSTFETVALDLRDLSAVEAFFAARRSATKPIAGIVHGAAVFKDGFLTQLDEASILEVLQPKVSGAWALHKALVKSGTPTDFFLSLSSVAHVIGSLGQANYVAANSFLEGLANYRAARGMPAQVVNLGALGETGFVAENAALGSYLESLGMLPMSSADTLDSLGLLAVSSATSRTVAAIDWSRIRSASGNDGVIPRLGSLMAGARKDDHKMRQMLAAAPPADWPALLQDFLVEEVSRVLDVEPPLIPVNRPLAELGLDSLSSIELKNRIETGLALTMTVGAFLQAPTLEKLSAVIAGTLEEQVRSERAAYAGPDAAAAEDPGKAFSDYQRWAIQVALAPMTSDEGRSELERLVLWRVDQRPTRGVVAEALSRLCDNVPPLALRWDPEGRALIFGAKPKIAICENVAALLACPLNLESGELFRIAASEQDGKIAEIGLRVHMATGVEGEELLNALLGGKPSLASYAASGASDADRLAAEARTRAVLEPWADAIELAGTRKTSLRCLDGLNIGRVVRREVLKTDAELSDVHCLLAFAEAIGGVSGRREMMIERFVRAPATSFPVRVILEPDRSLSLARITHQLSLSGAVLDTASIELSTADELDRREVRLRQFGFSFRHEQDPAPPAWNDLALHVVTSAAGSQVSLAYDEDAVDGATVLELAATLSTSLRAHHQRTNLATVGTTTATAESFIGARTRSSALPDVPLRPAGYTVSDELAILLDALSDPQATATLRRASMLCQAVRVRPGLDLQRLRRAVDMVVDRHEFLRARFVRHEGKWQACLVDQIAPLTVRDLGEEGEVGVLATLRSLANRPYDLGQEPLIEVHLLRLGAGGDVVLIKLLEAVADGWSLGIVLDDLLKAYIGIDLGQRPPGVAQLAELTTSSVGASMGEVNGAGGVADRLKLGPSQVRTLRLDAAGAKLLRRTAASSGTTENGLLAAAFAHALAAAGHGPGPALGTYDPARGDHRLQRVVAFLCRLVEVELPRDGDVREAAKQLDAQFLNLAAKPSVLDRVPEFIYAPLLPKQMLDRSLLGPALRLLSSGSISVLSLDVETMDVVPFGLQEGRLQLRPFTTHSGLELNFYYDLATFNDADVAEIGRSLLAIAGLPPSVVEGENLSEVIAAPEDLEHYHRSLEPA